MPTSACRAVAVTASVPSKPPASTKRGNASVKHVAAKKTTTTPPRTKRTKGVVRDSGPSVTTTSQRAAVTKSRTTQVKKTPVKESKSATSSVFHSQSPLQKRQRSLTPTLSTPERLLAEALTVFRTGSLDVDAQSPHAEKTGLLQRENRTEMKVESEAQRQREEEERQWLLNIRPSVMEPLRLPSAKRFRGQLSSLQVDAEKKEKGTAPGTTTKRLARGVQLAARTTGTTVCSEARSGSSLLRPSEVQLSCLEVNTTSSLTGLCTASASSTPPLRCRRPPRCRVLYDAAVLEERATVRLDWLTGGLVPSPRLSKPPNATTMSTASLSFSQPLEQDAQQRKHSDNTEEVAHSTFTLHTIAEGEAGWNAKEPTADEFVSQSHEVSASSSFKDTPFSLCLAPTRASNIVVPNLPPNGISHGGALLYFERDAKVQVEEEAVGVGVGGFPSSVSSQWSTAAAMAGPSPENEEAPRRERGGSGWMEAPATGGRRSPRHSIAKVLFPDTRVDSLARSSTGTEGSRDTTSARFSHLSTASEVSPCSAFIPSMLFSPPLPTTERSSTEAVVHTTLPSPPKDISCTPVKPDDLPRSNLLRTVKEEGHPVFQGLEAPVPLGVVNDAVTSPNPLERAGDGPAQSYRQSWTTLPPPPLILLGSSPPSVRMRLSSLPQHTSSPSFSCENQSRAVSPSSQRAASEPCVSTRIGSPHKANRTVRRSTPVPTSLLARRSLYHTEAKRSAGVSPHSSSSKRSAGVSPHASSSKRSACVSPHASSSKRSRETAASQHGGKKSRLETTTAPFASSRAAQNHPPSAQERTTSCGNRVQRVASLSRHSTRHSSVRGSGKPHTSTLTPGASPFRSSHLCSTPQQSTNVVVSKMNSPAIMSHNRIKNHVKKTEVLSSTSVPNSAVNASSTRTHEIKKQPSFSRRSLPQPVKAFELSPPMAPKSKEPSNVSGNNKSRPGNANHMGRVSVESAELRKSSASPSPEKATTRQPWSLESVLRRRTPRLSGCHLTQRRLGSDFNFGEERPE